MSIEEISEFKVAEKITTIYPPFLLSVGLIGSVLSIAVLSQPSNRKTSTGVLLIILAVTDSLILINSVLLNWLAFVSDFDFRNSSTGTCKLHVFTTYLLLQISAWLLVFVTAERVFSVLYPFTVREVFTRRRVLVAIVILILFLAGLNGHLVYGVDISAETLQCHVKENHVNFMFKIWTWIDFAFAFAIPFCVLLSGNVTIMFKLRSSQRFRARTTSVQNSDYTGQSNGETVRRGDKRSAPYFTVTALTLNIAFLVFVSPFVIFAIGQPYWFSPDSITTQRHADLILIGTVTKMLMYTNSGINFILYILSGSKFRKDFGQVLCCHRKLCHSVPEHMSSNRDFHSMSNISRISSSSTYL